MKSFRQKLSTIGKVAAIVASLGSFAFFPQEQSFADDTELFTQPPGTTPPPPNVLFVLDNSSNWTRASGGFPYGDYGANQLKAIKDVVNTLNGPVNVGVMMFASEGANEGAYIRIGARDMSVAGNKAKFGTILDGIAANVNDPDEKINVAKKNPSAGMLEAYRYFGGLSNHFPTSGTVKEDYSGNPETKTTTSAGFTSGWAYPASTGGVYTSPISTAVPCARNYIIYLANNANNAGSLGSQTIGGITVGSQMTLAAPYAAASTNWFDEWAKYLYTQGVPVPTGGATAVNGKVVTYTVDVYEGSPDNPAYSAVLKNSARVAGGRYFQVQNYDVLVQSISDIFKEIQSVNSVFASVALPVSVNVRGTNLNQVYLGVFRPDASAAPNWPGNVKQYKLGLDSNENLILVDKNDAAALSNTTGFFQSGAVSYWTSANTYWDFEPDSNSSSPTSDAPDGPLVERGGVNQVLRWNAQTSTLKNADDRKVYTYLGNPGTPVALGASTLFDNANAALQVNTKFNAVDNTERQDIINWIRGKDLNDENQNGSITDLRPRAHGDVVHSRPAVINYNRYGDDNDVVVYYGANDGLLHATQGGQNATNGAPRIAGGAEYWSFAAEEFFTGFKRMKDNSPKINWSGGALSFGSNANMVASSPFGVITPATSLTAGYNVSGAGVAAGATVSSVTAGGALSLSNAATITATNVDVRLSPGAIPNGTLTSGSPTISFSAGLPSYITPGLTVSGTGIPVNSVITGVSFSSTVPLSNPATATSTENATISLKTVPSAWFANGNNRVFFPGLASGTTPGAAFGISTDLKVSGAGIVGGAAGSAITNANITADLLTLNAVPTSSGYYTGITTPQVVSTAINAGVPTNAASSCAGASTCNMVVKANNNGANTNGTKSNDFTVGRYIKINGAAGVQLKIISLGTISGGGGAATRTIQVQACDATLTCGVAGVPNRTWAANVTVTPHDVSAGAVFDAILTNTTKAIITGFSSGSLASLTAATALTIPSGPTGLTVASTTTAGVPGIVLDNNTTAAGSGVNLSYFFNATGADFTAASTTMTLSQADAAIVGSMASSAAGFANLAVTTVGATVPVNTSLSAAPANPQITLDQNATTSGVQALSVFVRFTADTYLGQNFIRITAGDINAVSVGWAATGSGIPGSTALSAKYGSATFFTMSANAGSGGSQLMTFTSAGAAGGPKPYFFDGPIGVYRRDAPNTGAGATLTQGDGKIIDGSCDAAVSTDCDKVVIYVPMRRGGRMIYAFDVTDPVAPKFMWKIGNTSLGFEEMGQSWSTPNPVEMNIGGTMTPVLVFGGGYDAAYDDQDPLSGTRTMGRAVYFVNANTGGLIKVFKGTGTTAQGGGATGGMSAAQLTAAAEMTCSIPSDVSVLTRDPRTGFTLPGFRAYVGDTCGQMWRIDTADTNPENWVVTRMANVGNKSTANGAAVPSPAGANAHDRKFLAAPDVVYGGKDGRGLFHYILIGSGDREHPFNGYGDTTNPDSEAVTNRFYMFKDYNIGSGALIYSAAAGQLAPVAPSDISYTNAGGTAVTITGVLPYTEAVLYDATADLIQLSTATATQKQDATLATDNYHGWYITLEKGEKVVGGSTTASGSVFFGTNVPTPNTAACNNNLGEARLYQVNIKNAAAVPPSPLTAVTNISARYTVIPGGGLPPTPVPVAVVIDGKFKEGVIAGTAVVQPQETIVGSRLRVYNRKVVDR